MSRILLQFVMPLLLPTVAYCLWVAYYRKRAEATGEAPPEITKGGLFWSLCVGFGLLIVSLIALAVVSGEDPGQGGYQAPRLEDGRITEPQFK